MGGKVGGGRGGYQTQLLTQARAEVAGEGTVPAPQLGTLLRGQIGVCVTIHIEEQIAGLFFSKNHAVM